jgi:hypothetical protein
MSSSAAAAVATFVTARALHEIEGWLDFVASPHAAPSGYAWLPSGGRARRLVRLLVWALSHVLSHSQQKSQVISRVLAFIPLDAGEVLPNEIDDDEAAGAWRVSLCRPVGHEGRSVPPALLVRVLTSNAAFGEEELNTFYGRYGFTRGVVVHAATGLPVADQNKVDPDEDDPLEAKAHGRMPVSAPGWLGSLYQSHFVVSFETHHAAESAMREVSDPALDLVCFAVPCGVPLESASMPLRALPPVEATAAALTAALGKLYLAASTAAGGASGAMATTGQPFDDALESAFVPDLLVDGIPYFTTAEQLLEHFGQYGDVASVKLSIDDRSGASHGCALVRMRTFADAVKASDMNGKQIGGSEVLCGVLDPNLNVVSILDGSVLHESHIYGLAPSAALGSGISAGISAGISTVISAGISVRVGGGGLGTDRAPN